MYKEISINDLDNINNLNLIDIRDNNVFLEGTIPNSKNIPYIYLLNNPDKYIDKEKLYYIFCNSGFSSKKICMILSKKGYNVINIKEGYNFYKSGSI